MLRPSLSQLSNYGYSFIDLKYCCKLFVILSLFEVIPGLQHTGNVHLKYHITLTSWWPRWRLKSPVSRLFTQSFIRVQIKENIKTPRHWPLCREFTGDRWIPRTKDRYAENVSIWWRHHANECLTQNHYGADCFDYLFDNWKFNGTTIIILFVLQIKTT